MAVRVGVVGVKTVEVWEVEYSVVGAGTGVNPVEVVDDMTTEDGVVKDGLEVMPVVVEGVTVDGATVTAAAREVTGSPVRDGALVRSVTGPGTGTVPCRGRASGRWWWVY